ncbi:cytochrome P450 [Macrolepiota fuliginosa MF-IS2]|uniref:Cytochrome P450 n=1 Tax=Macrolepiota fuliginosa MF-IS2 TaxID=1400762 RepID=A0A9P6BY28_9AGAR|nr:cytochrome P450 [Macrolepiota fuliginosa MF-IS2]
MSYFLPKSVSILEAAAALVVLRTFRHDESTWPPRLIMLLVGVPVCIYVLFGDKSGGTILGCLMSLIHFHATLILSILLHRLSPWHPLAQYPGPVLCKVSKIYWAIITRSGQQHKLLVTLHERYGDIVRIGPNEVSIINPSAIDPLMGSSGQPKGQFWEGRLPESAPARNLVGVRDKKEHTRRRKTWLRALNPTALKHYEGVLVARTQQMVELLSEKIPGPVDMSEWIGYYAFDVMGDVVFGEGPEMMKNGDENNLWHLLERSQQTLFFFGTIPWFGKLMLRLATIIPLLPGVRQYRSYTINRVIRRKQQGSPHKDLFYHLIDEDGVLEQKPTNAELLSDSALSIVAGADTTAGVVVGFIYCILRHPKVYKRVQEEVDSLGSDFMNPDKQARLTYLNATLDETLRMFPPVLSGSQREIKRGTGTAVIGPYPLEEGTAASIPPALVHKDSRNFFPHPEQFLPERWLPEGQRVALEPEIFNNKTTFTLNQNAFLAFSHGPANCVGKHLAYVEMRMVICTMLHQFGLKFAPGYNPQQYEDDIRDYYIAAKGSLPVMVTCRQ